MTSTLFLPLALGIAGLFYRAWLFRQDMQGRILGSLALISIAMYTYGFALYGACRGEVDFLHRPFACTRAAAIPYNPDAYRIGRAR
jgi:hypothetical protein